MKLLLNAPAPPNHLTECLNTNIHHLPKKGANINITFGDPRRNCTGSGICRILSLEQKTQPCCKGFKVEGYLRRFNDENLIIRIYKSQLTTQQKEKFFSQNHIVCSVDILLNSSIAKALGMDSLLHICAGQYALFEEAQHYGFFARFQIAFVYKQYM